MKIRLTLLIFFACCWFARAQKLLSPEEFLGYELGERFTPHHRMVDYFKHVDASMSNVVVRQYGETYEHRPLIYAVLTSNDNFIQLEKIRRDNLKRTGLLDGSPGSDKKAIVWLSYNVHGNEASSLEASMLTLYALADPTNAKSQEWLKNTVVIMDPCINPDGRDRYANFYNQYLNKPASSDIDAKEHHEPWPGGRSNHYLFDLNRDWAWGTQLETRYRLKIYQEWMPHVHVDFHEQGYNNPYYFAPAAEPFHEVITPWQREFQTIIGKNNAKYFDKEGWLYFTKEIFDLYYPSYGDTYPTYNGAVGMTYEQGGGGAAGLRIKTKEGDDLTLRDRLMHHYTSGLSTVEITSINATRVVDEFENYFRESITNPASPYKAYVVKAGNNGDKIRRLTEWLDLQSITYGRAAAARSMRGFDYKNQTTANFNLTTEDLVINVFQPKSRFITTVFEPQSKLADSLTYDITAWNLIYAFNLDAYAVNEKVNIGGKFQLADAATSNLEKPYAYIFKYESINDVTFVAEAMKDGIKVRAAEKPFTINGTDFQPGSVIITRRNNESITDFDQKVTGLARKHGRQIFTSATGFASKGKDVGAADVKYLKPPKVAVLFGNETNSLSAGEIWHFFEEQIQYPITQIGTHYFNEIELKNYDVLIIPEGSYKMFNDENLNRVGSWVSAGGKLIVIGSGLNAFAEKKGYALKTYVTDANKADAEKKEKLLKEKEILRRYEDTERNEISNTISGAIYKVSIDQSHPLAFGTGNNTYYTLKTRDSRYAYLEGGWNVGIIKGPAKPVQGFAGRYANKKMDNSVVFGVEEKGSGTVVYLVDNPLFRSFWESGKMIFSNAVFMVGQ